MMNELRLVQNIEPEGALVPGGLAPDLVFVLDYFEHFMDLTPVWGNIERVISSTSAHYSQE